MQTKSGFEALEAHLRDRALACTRPPVDRFQHAWFSPVPMSARVAEVLESRRHPGVAPAPQAGDGFTGGDYGLGLFHHDASEAAIELLRHPTLRDAMAGSLLCLLDCADANGCIHRTELPFKTRDREPARPVMAQYALRVAQVLGADWLAEHRVVPRIRAFVEHLEQHWMGAHGLLRTVSPRASGFDSDILSASAPDGTVEGPDGNAFLVLEYEALAELCALVGEDGTRWTEKSYQLRNLMNALMWVEDDRGGFYVALRWRHGSGTLESDVVSLPGRDGRHTPLESWISLVPLYAGIPDDKRAARLIARLLREDGYWGPWGVRTLPRDSLFFQQAPRVLLHDERRGQSGPVSNWNGPVWVLPNYYLFEGLRRYGHGPEARLLALRTAQLLSQDLANTGVLHECYNDAGVGLWPHTGTFISWNVLALTMLRALAPV